MKTTIPVPGAPNSAYGLGLIDHTPAATTADGRHALALNFNAEWTGDTDAVIEGEFCWDEPHATPVLALPALPSPDSSMREFVTFLDRSGAIYGAICSA